MRQICKMFLWRQIIGRPTYSESGRKQLYVGLCIIQTCSIVYYCRPRGSIYRFYDCILDRIALASVNRYFATGWGLGRGKLPLISKGMGELVRWSHLDGRRRGVR